MRIYSASSSPLLLRGASDYVQHDTVSELTTQEEWKMKQGNNGKRKVRTRQNHLLEIERRTQLTQPQLSS